MKRTGLTVVIRILDIPTSALVAAAGIILQGITCVVVDWVRSVTMDAIIAAAGAIVQGMGRMMRDRVASCPHESVVSFTESQCL